MFDGATDGDVCGDACTEEGGGFLRSHAVLTFLNQWEGVIEPSATFHVPEGTVAGDVSCGPETGPLAGDEVAIVAGKDDNGCGSADKIE